MKIAQIVAPGAGEYERKSQRIDLAALSQAGHEVAVYDDARDLRDADIAHVYGEPPRKLRIAHVIDAQLDLPEAVEDHFFASGNRQPATSNAIGTFARKSIENVIKQTYARVSRTRDDIEW